MSKIQTELEQVFLKYQGDLIEWNEAIGELHKAQKLTDSLQNRINLQNKHQTLGKKYDQYKKTQKLLQDKILEKNIITPNWSSMGVKESDDK